MAKISQRQIVAEISPVSGGAPRFGDRRENSTWAQVSGGEITAQVEKVYDGGAIFPDSLCAVPEVGDITVTRHFDPVRDGEPLKLLRQRIGSARYDIYIYVMDCDMKVAGTERVYSNALVVGLSEPEGDSASSAGAVYSLTFAIGGVAA